MQRIILLVLVSLFATPAAVLGEKGDKAMDKYAKRHYERALEYYSAEKYRKAADAFHRAYKLDKRMEILFGWAQSKRLSGDCKGATKLYRKLLRRDLAEADEEAVVEGLGLCGVEGEKVKKKKRPRDDEEEREDEGEDEIAENEVEPPAKPKKKAPEVEEPVEAANEKQDDEEDAATASVKASSDSSGGGSPWYTDPVGDGLLVTGVIGLGVGVGYFLVSSSDRSAADEATNYETYTTLADRASTRRTIAILATSASAALITGAIVRFVMRDSGAERTTTATAWGSSDGAGLAIGGRF